MRIRIESVQEFRNSSFQHPHHQALMMDRRERENEGRADDMKDISVSAGHCFVNQVKQQRGEERPTFDDPPSFWDKSRNDFLQVPFRSRCIPFLKSPFPLLTNYYSFFTRIEMATQTLL